MAWLGWGVRDSFLRYLDGVPDAETILSPEVRRDAEGRFWWPAELDGRGGAAARGSVELRAHGGMLRVLLDDPMLEVASGEAVLRVGAGAGGRRIGLGPARTGDPDGVVAELRLLPEAVALFGGSYPAGDPLDPVLLREAPFLDTSQEMV